MKKRLFELEAQIKQSADLIELKKEKKKGEQAEKEVELLKKFIASFLIGYQKVNKKVYTKKDITQIYQTVYELLLMGNDAKKLF
ncbi:hypothetical protein [Spiroplasma endosymbiont of Dioctria linearis]|uniref:hypothetical protein n=1 Tax=Spiroplasma endosymbiont of Dioctria linearis TaxID=3066290 RepID=UPI00313E42E3